MAGCAQAGGGPTGGKSEQRDSALLRALLAYLGEKDRAAHEFSTCCTGGIDLKRDEVVPLWVTRNCAALGRRAEAIRQIGRAQASRVNMLNYSAVQLRLDPLWESLRGDPEFAQLIAKAEAGEKAEDSRATSL